MTTDWIPDTRPVEPELEDGYPAHTFGTPTHFVPIAQKLDAATFEQLRAIAAGGIGNPTT